MSSCARTCAARSTVRWWSGRSRSCCRRGRRAARPLTEFDHVLRDLLLSFLFVIGGGIVLAATIGAVIGRSALRPIARFTRRTESITGALDRTQRIEEVGVDELARLARSFNA